MIKRLLSALLFIASPALAVNVMEAGVGALNSFQNNYSDIKFLEYDGVICSDYFNYLGGVGHWWDDTRHTGAKDSFYFRSGLGLVTHTPPVTVGFYAGPAIITSPDSILGSNLQFALELNLMVVDKRWIGVGATAKHFSNAGIVKPNEGRNMAGLRIQFP